MNEKTNKIKLPKYSSYLTDTDSELLDLFCTQFDCSKAKALPLLLKYWNDNKDKVSNELATISSEDISAKKYEDRLATIEDKLANISYDTELATIKTRLATLENMLATIADNELATISNELANDNELVGIEKTEDNLLGAILDNIQKEETPTNKPVLPTELVNDVIVPKIKNEGKKTASDKVLEYINFKYKGEKIANRAHFAELCEVDNTFFSQKKGKAIWEQYVIPITEKRGDKEVITHYLLNSK